MAGDADIASLNRSVREMTKVVAQMARALEAINNNLVAIGKIMKETPVVNNVALGSGGGHVKVVPTDG